MILATVETRNFTFQALGETKGQAADLLLKAWKAHVRQYGGPSNVDSHMMRELVADDEVTYTYIEVGTVTRDGETIYHQR